MIICFLIDGFFTDKTIPINGTMVQGFNIARELILRNHDVHYITATLSKNEITRTIEQGIKVHWIPLKSRNVPPIINFFSYLKLIKLINPDIIYNRGRNYLTFIGAIYARRHSKKFIWASNADDGCGRWKFTKKTLRQDKIRKKLFYLPFSIIEDFLYSYGIRKASECICQTGVQKEELKKVFKKESLIIKSGYTINPHFKLKKRHQILWVSSLSTFKQPELFIELAKSLKKYPKWKFILVGGSINKDYNKTISRLSLGLDNLYFIPGVSFSRTNSFFEESELFISTSKSEGISNTFIQAWMNGVPVLSLNHNPDGDFEKFNVGKCAYGDFAKLVEITMVFMENDSLRNEYSRNSIIYAKRTYDIKSVVDDYESLFN